MYSKISKEIIASLKKISQTDINFDIKYSSDENTLYQNMPEIVIFPKTTEEIQKIIKIADKYIIPVTTRGAGTSVTGSAVPLYGGICLSTEKMNKILEIDKNNGFAICQAGVINNNLQIELEKYGLFYPPDPASMDKCTIGGNVALNAGGMHALKYGSTNNYVTGLTAVTASGEIIKTGGKLKKNSTGYNLTALLTGSEGTLAIITEIIIKVEPKPTHKKIYWIALNSLNDSINLLREVSLSNINPSIMEFMEKDCIYAWQEYSQKKHHSPESEAHLLIQIDGFAAEDLLKKENILKKTIKKHSINNLMIANDKKTINYFWEVRNNISKAMKFIAKQKISEDIVVPPSAIPVFIKKLKKISNKTGIDCVGYGHLGDGNVHVNILKRDTPDEIWKTKTHELITQIFELTISLGGNISGEHGIGLTKKNYLQQNIGLEQLKLMKSIKKSFDAKNILNPGKIFENIN